MKERIVFQGSVGLLYGILTMQLILGVQRDARPLLLLSFGVMLLVLKGPRLKVLAIGFLLGLLTVGLHQITAVPTGALLDSKEISGHIVSVSSENQTAVVELKANFARQVKPIKVKVYGIDAVSHGDHVMIKGQFLAPERALNPYDFDPYLYMMSNNWVGTFFCMPDGVRVVEKSKRLVDSLMNRRSDWIDEIRELSLYGSYWTGFVIGEDDGLSEEATHLIRQTGLAHVMAVSGLHVGVIYAFLTYTMGAVIVSRKHRDILVLVFLLGYLAINLGSFTVLRAVVLVLYHHLGFYTARRPDVLTAIGCVAGVSLLFNPFLVFHLSFTLSIGAAVSIACFYSAFQKRLLFLGRSLSSSLALILSAQLGILPVQLYVFNVFYPESILFNLLFVPLFSLMICFAFILSVLSLIPGSSVYLAMIFDVVMGIVENTLWRMSAVFHNPIYMTGLHVILLVMILTLVIGFCYSERKHRMVLAVTLSVCLGLLQLTKGLQGLEVILWSTGKSDAILIQYDGKSHMIDTAEGKQDLGLLLLKNDIHTLETLVITHEDKDHVGGLKDIQEKLKIKQLIRGLSGPAEVRDKELILGLFYGEPQQSDNNASIVTLLTYKDYTMLFMGDAEAEREEQLVADGLLKAVDVLKVGHHGSNTSTTSFFLSAIKPKVALIPCDGSKYFPRQEVLERLTDCGILVYRTDQSGAIRLSLRPDGLRVKEYLRE